MLEYIFQICIFNNARNVLIKLSSIMIFIFMYSKIKNNYGNTALMLAGKH